MPTRPRRPCTWPGCPNLVPSGRCPQHPHPQQRGTTTQRGYGTNWKRSAAQAIDTYRAQHGDMCPGFDRLPHLVPGDWVCDHDLGPMCRSCNARKAATVDRARAQARRQRR